MFAHVRMRFVRESKDARRTTRGQTRPHQVCKALILIRVDAVRGFGQVTHQANFPCGVEKSAIVARKAGAAKRQAATQIPLADAGVHPNRSRYRVHVSTRNAFAQLSKGVGKRDLHRDEGVER